MSENDRLSSDVSLVSRVQAGESEAFDEIDRKYRNKLCRFLTRYTFCVHQAEELGQRTMIQAFKMIGQLKSGEKLVGWLHRIAFHLAAAESRRRKPISLDQLDGLEPIAKNFDFVPLDEESTGIWKLAEQHLSAEEYLILVFRYRDDLPLAEIAEKLNKKEGAVRVQLHRARKKLLPVFQEFQD